MRTALAYWVRLLDVESGAEGPGEGENICLGRGFLVSVPFVGPPLYECGAFGGFVIYDGKRGGGANDSCPTSVVTDGNQVCARDLEPREVAMQTSARTRGRPRGSLNKRRPGCTRKNCRPKNVCRKCAGGKSKEYNPKTRSPEKVEQGEYI